MVKAFTYIGDLSTILDYARWRLNDTDSQVTVDETGAPSPYLWDATYTALFGISPTDNEGIAKAAEVIATKLSTDPTSFGKANGIRVTFRNASYYEKLADLIRSEPPFNLAEGPKLIRAGGIVTGKRHNYEEYNRIFAFPPQRIIRYGPQHRGDDGCPRPCDDEEFGPDEECE